MERKICKTCLHTFPSHESAPRRNRHDYYPLLKHSPATVKLLKRLLGPWVDEGIITVAEEKEIIAHLKHLAEKGRPMPPITPKLLDQRQAAEMLGVSLSNFKKQEKVEAFPFNRRMVGSSVRYRNLDVLDFIMTDDSASD